MANKRLTDLDEITEVNDNMLLHVVDPEDISQSPEGSSYKIKKSNLVSGGASSVTPNSVVISDEIGNIQGADFDFYPDLTELSFLKGVNTAIQTQLGGKQNTLVSGTDIKTYDGVSILGSGNIVPSFKTIELSGGFQVTGAAANTIAHSIMIPAGTITKVTRLISKAIIKRTGTNANATFRFYLNTSNSITGATVIAIYTNTTGQAYNPFEREFVVNTSVIEGFSFAQSSLNDKAVAGSFSSIPFDETVNQWIIFAIQPLSALDVFDVQLQELSIVS